MCYRAKVFFISIFVIASLILFAITLFQPTPVSAATGYGMSQSISPTISPTASTSTSNTSQPAGGLNPAILVAIIGLGGGVVGALIAGAFAVYQMRQNVRLEQAMQTRNFQHEQEMERLRKEIEIQYKDKEQEEERQATTAEELRLKMLLAPGSERTETYRLALHADPRISQLQILDMSRPLAVCRREAGPRLQ